MFPVKQRRTGYPSVALPPLRLHDSSGDNERFEQGLFSETGTILSDLAMTSKGSNSHQYSMRRLPRET